MTNKKESVMNTYDFHISVRSNQKVCEITQAIKRIGGLDRVGFSGSMGGSTLEQYVEVGPLSPVKENHDKNDDSSIKPGDVVQLKSGGPSSTVSRVEGVLIEVVWFNEGDDQYHTFLFPDSVLIKIET